MSPTVDRPEPPYLQIVKRISEQIRSGELRDGDTVPSTRKLAAEWNVSWPTAAKALTMLQSEGLVRGVVGVGTVVCAGIEYGERVSIPGRWSTHEYVTA